MLGSLCLYLQEFEGLSQQKKRDAYLQITKNRGLQKELAVEKEGDVCNAL